MRLLSIRYNNLKEGKAINISITAGVIVQINSISVNTFILSYKTGLYLQSDMVFCVAQT